MHCTRGSAWATALTSSAVPSGELSSTKITCQAIPLSAASSLATRGLTLAFSLNVGETTVSSTAGGALTRRGRAGVLMLIASSAKLCPSNPCLPIAPAVPVRQRPSADQNSPASRLMVRASTTVLNTNDRTPCTVPIRRRGLDVNEMSAVWLATPMITAKCTKSQ